MSAPEIEAGELYDRIIESIRLNDVTYHSIASHIIQMISGTINNPGPLWRVRVVKPRNEIITLDKFEDYLLKSPNKGLGFPSLYFVYNMLTAHDKGQKAIDLIRREIPNFDEIVSRDKARLLVARSDAAKKHGGTGANQHTKSEISRVDNINSAQAQQKVAKGGTSPSYIIARLKRDAADPHNPKAHLANILLEQIEDAEISARKAAIAMGYIKRPGTKKKTGVDLIISEIPNLSNQELRQILVRIREVLQDGARLENDK